MRIFWPFQASIVTVLGSRPASAAGVFKFFKMTATKHSAITATLTMERSFNFKRIRIEGPLTVRKASEEKNILVREYK